MKKTELTSLRDISSVFYIKMLSRVDGLMLGPIFPVCCSTKSSGLSIFRATGVLILINT